jgi:hypothetical protein
MSRGMVAKSGGFPAGQNSGYDPHQALKSKAWAAVSGRFSCGGTFAQLPFGTQPVNVN